MIREQFEPGGVTYPRFPDPQTSLVQENGKVSRSADGAEGPFFFLKIIKRADFSRSM